MPTIQIEARERLRIVRMSKPRANAIDEELVRDLSRSMEELGRDDGVGGVLLASAHPRVFCPGLDLVSLLAFDRDRLTRFMQDFGRMVQALFALPRPLVAALGGHAIAGGCVLALTADWRILRDDVALMGLNEVRIGVPLPWSVVRLLRHELPPQHVCTAALDGRNLSGREAVDAGFAHATAPAEGFEEACLERLATLARRERQAFALTKAALRQPTLDLMRAHEDDHVPAFVDAWFAPATQERLRAQVAALTGTG